MEIIVDQRSSEPLYLQIRSQIIAAIANGELCAGDGLPSVRSLASDLGINLHTVNKAYAVLRDEGYVLMRGRSGALVADVQSRLSSLQGEEAVARLEQDLLRVAIAFRARGLEMSAFLACSQTQAEKAYGQVAATRQEDGSWQEKVAGREKVKGQEEAAGQEEGMQQEEDVRQEGCSQHEKDV